MFRYKKKFYKLFVIFSIFFVFLIVPSSVSAQKPSTVVDKLTDVLIPVFGGNKKNDKINKEYLTGFSGRLARNLTSNGIELLDFFSTVGNDILFKPNKSFWDVTKETYQEFVNQEWSLESANYFHGNVPNLSGGSNKWESYVTFTRGTVGGNLADYKWTLKVNRAVGGSFVSRARVNGLNRTDFQNGVTKNNVTAHYYNMLSDYSSATYKFTVDSSVSSIVIDSSVYSVDDEQYITGRLTGTKHERTEELTNVTPFVPEDLNNSGNIDIFIDNKINNFFPGSLNNENSDTVYIINNTNIDNSVIQDINIDENYITNNEIIQVSEKELSDGVPPLPLPPSEDYTGILENILGAIRNLPQQIRDKFNDFTGGGSEPEPVEEGKGFWASLFDAIAELVRSFGDFMTSIPDLLINLLDGLLGLVEKVVELFIPTAEQMDQLKNSFSGLSDELSLKFAPVTDTAGAISDIYSSPKSVYDLSINYQGEEMPVIPVAFREGISSFKSVLNGFIIVSTFISIYKRFVGREDIIK